MKLLKTKVYKRKEKAGCAVWEEGPRSLCCKSPRRLPPGRSLRTLAGQPGAGWLIRIPAALNVLHPGFSSFLPHFLAKRVPRDKRGGRGEARCLGKPSQSPGEQRRASDSLDFTLYLSRYSSDWWKRWVHPGVRAPRAELGNIGPGEMSKAWTLEMKHKDLPSETSARGVEEYIC